MTGSGVLHLIDGHHLDMIDGGITIGGMPGITMVGTIMGGTIGTIILIIIEHGIQQILMAEEA